jgi:predicted nucleic acid-binding protein
VIVVDTGPLVALVDADDNHHKACSAWFGTVDRRHLVVPAPVIAEVCHLIAHHCGSRVEATFLDDMAQGSYGTPAALLREDLARMSELVARYASLPLGGTRIRVMALSSVSSGATLLTPPLAEGRSPTLRRTSSRSSSPVPER